MIKEGQTLHDRKRLAPLLPPFSIPNPNFLELSLDSQLQLLVNELANYKSTFSCFSTALEWGCTTGPRAVANLIIAHFPILVAMGDVVWRSEDEKLEREKKELMEVEVERNKKLHHSILEPQIETMSFSSPPFTSSSPPDISIHQFSFLFLFSFFFLTEFKNFGALWESTNPPGMCLREQSVE